MAQKVWVVTTNEYGDSDILCVCDTSKLAIGLIKEIYKHPCLVDWVLDEYDDGFMLTGYFEAVQHYSPKHTSRFYIEPWEINVLKYLS